MNITEKVSPMHPDKIADRIAGALVDYCYKKDPNPKCAFEVLIGHNRCYITGETSVHIPEQFVRRVAKRISGIPFQEFRYIEVPQDDILATNQISEPKCGDNGVFAGFPMPTVHKKVNRICHKLYSKFPTDGKIVINEKTNEITICWSNATTKAIKAQRCGASKINPLGYWTGGVNVDTGITGRKLASDFYGLSYPLGGGTIHGKDLSKADCSVNIYCFVMAQRKKRAHRAICSIGDTTVNVNGKHVPFAEIIDVAKEYIASVGGFEKLAEWGLQ